jgi:type IV secretion system protein TrbL
VHAVADAEDAVVLTRLLTVFLFNFTTGMQLLTPSAMALLTFFFGLELSLVGLWYLYDHEFNPRPLLSKVFTVGVLSFVILNWPFLVKTVARTFVGWGLQAGGAAVAGGTSAMVETDFTDPDNIAKYGFQVTAVLFTHLSQYSGLWAIKNIPEVMLSGLVCLLIILFYFGLAVWVFVSLLEFYYAAVAAVILLPFGMSSLLAHVAEKMVAWMLAAGVRLFVLAFLLSVALPVLVTIQTTLTDSMFVQACWLLLGAMTLCVLCWRAGAFSAGLTWGTPQLTATDAVAFVNMMSQQMTNLGTKIDALGAALSSRGQGASNGASTGGATPGRGT